MKFTVLLLLSSLIFSSAFADIELDALRKSFEPDMAAFLVTLDKAATLKGIEFPLGNPIDKKTCDEIKSKIRANYHVDPFEQAFDKGSSEFRFCQTAGGYLTDTTAKSQMGLSAAYLLQEKTSQWNRQYLNTLLLDSQYRVIEYIGLGYFAGKVVEFNVQSADSSGNVYRQSQYVSSIDTEKNITGPETWQTFVSNKGVIHHLLRYLHVDAVDPKKNVLKYQFQKADKQDWDQYELPLTHAWLHGFYSYGSTLRADPKNYRLLYVSHRDGKEVCADGYIQSENNFVSVPKDPALFCNNN